MHPLPRWTLIALGLLTAGCDTRRSSSADAGAPSKGGFNLSLSTETADGLMVMHHPSGFEVKTTSSPEGSAVILHGQAPHHGSATLVSKPHIGLDLDAFVKQFHEPKPTETSEQRKPGTCVGKPGLVITSSWQVKGFPFVRWRCYVVSGGRGAIASYEVIQEEAAEHEPLLRAMVDSAVWKKK